MEKKYQTRPWKLWAKAKELRTSYYKDVMTAKEQGKLLVAGGTDSIVSLPAGLGPYIFFGGEPYGATLATDKALSLQCVEAVEGKKFARDMCAYMRNYWGSMFLDKSPWGKFPVSDFCMTLHFCDSHGKWYQQVSEYEKVPYFAIDFPVIPIGQRTEAKWKYLADQINDAIEWMQKKTGRKWDDEKFIQAVKNDCKSSYLWSKICELNKGIPATMDEKTMFSLYIIGVLERQTDRCVKFYEELLEEAQERVKDGIAAVATERLRVLHDSQPPWYFLDMWRYLESYGVVCVGAYYSYNLGGSVGELPDGSFGAIPTPEMQGNPLKTRQDAVNALAQWYGEKSITCTQFTLPQIRAPEVYRIIKDWKANGIIIHLNRGCEGTAMGQREVRIYLMEHDVPVMTYEGSMADHRDLDENRVRQRIDGFMQTLGLQKLAAK